jgi:hypothetical protein
LRKEYDAALKLYENIIRTYPIPSRRTPR